MDMDESLKTWTRDGFNIEIYPTHCGSLAYKVCDGEQEIFHNNNFYASKKAMDDIQTDLIVFELIKTIEDQTNRLDDYHLSYVPEKKKEWIELVDSL